MPVLRAHPHDRRDSELCQGDFPMKPKNPFKLDGAGPLSEKALEALDHVDPSRRDFLKTAGVMMIGFGIGAATAPTAEAQSPINPSGNVDNTQVDNWVAVGADESIIVFAGKAELGTGMRTLQLQLAAEELSVPMDRITLILCRSGVTPNQGLTVGSLSRSEEHTSELQSPCNLVCRLLLEKKKNKSIRHHRATEHTT